MRFINSFVSSVTVAAAIAVGSLLGLSAPAKASPVYSSPLPPNQNWTGSLGLDFTVNTPVAVDALGAYFGGGPGSTISVEIFTAGGAPVPGLFAEIFTTTSPYTFVPVPTVVLPPGEYQVTAWGYGPIANYNTGFGGPPIGFNTLAGALSEGLPYYNDPNVIGFAFQHLDNFNGGGLHFYGAGNFDVLTPLPAALPLFAGGLGLIGLLARRRKHKLA